LPSSDWPAIAEKHHAHSVFRALETGAVFAKSEYSLNSSIVDDYGASPRGAVKPEGSEGIRVADVPLRNGMPLAARLGDWVGRLCVAGAGPPASRANEQHGLDPQSSPSATRGQKLGGSSRSSGRRRGFLRVFRYLREGRRLADCA